MSYKIYNWYQFQRISKILESNNRNNTIMNVDIQPEYMDNNITFNLHDWAEYINEKSVDNNIVFLYNGEDTLDMISETSYQIWLHDIGIDIEVIESAIFYDKGYAFFRFCIDNHIDEDSIVSLIQYMIEHGTYDSREIEESMWDKYIKEVGDDGLDIRELLEFSGDMISIPDLMDFLRNFDDIILTGGGLDECLKEVELALMSLDKSYDIDHRFVF